MMQKMYVYGGHCSGLQVLQGIQCWKHFGQVAALQWCGWLDGWAGHVGNIDAAHHINQINDWLKQGFRLLDSLSRLATYCSQYMLWLHNICHMSAEVCPYSDLLAGQRWAVLAHVKMLMVFVLCNREQIRAKLAQLKLNDADVWVREERRKQKTGDVVAPWYIKAPFWVLCVLLDVCFANR
jgi:hypothetical protein